MKSILYARVSSKEQEKEGYSIPAQLKLLNDYANQKGFEVVREFIDVETAKTAGRTQFREMVKYLKGHKSVKRILVEKTDRLYRNFKDYVNLEDLDLEIHLVREGDVLSKDSKSHVKFIHGIKVLMAKNYIDNLSEEVRKGMREKVEQGGFPGKAPVGYINNTKTHTVDVDEEKAGFIRKLFEWYATGEYSLDGLRKKCKERGFVTRRSEKVISRSNVEKILKSIFYTGFFKWNGGFYRGGHTPIVSQELFDRVREAFKNHNKPKKKERDFAYKGLLTCGNCGCAITAEIKKGKYIYYHCTGFKGKCGEPYLREDTLEEKFGDLLKGFEIDRERFQWIKEALKHSHEEEREYHNSKIQDLTSRYTLLQKRLDEMYVDKLDGKVSEDFWQSRSQEWRREQEKIRKTIEGHEKANRSYFEEGIRILELSGRAYSLYLERDSSEKRRLLNLVLSNCTLKDATLYPTYKKPFDIIAQRAKSQEWLGLVEDLRTFCLSPTFEFNLSELNHFVNA